MKIFYQFSDPLGNTSQETQFKQMKDKGLNTPKCVDVHYLQVFFTRRSIHDGRMNDYLINFNLQTKSSAILLDDGLIM